MQLIWQKGHFSWIASHPERSVQPNERFPLVEAPDNPAIGALVEQLLSHGGKAVVIMFGEEVSCAVFVEYGSVTAYHSIHLELGEPGECHSNSASLWRANQNEFTLVTGYGLSEDGLWRRHSWLINREQALIETTIGQGALFWYSASGETGCRILQGLSGLVDFTLYPFCATTQPS